MKYIFLDIDGTLFDNNTFQIAESAYRAVEMAARAGNRIFICTGRSCCMLNHVEDIAYEGVVAAAGAYVEVEKEIIYEENIPDMELKRILKCCDRRKISYILEGKAGLYLHPAVKAVFHSEEDNSSKGLELFERRIAYDLCDYDAGKDIIYKLCIYAGEEGTLPKLKEELSSDYHIIFGQTDEKRGYNAELTLAANNKASGIKKVLAHYGGNMRDTVAVGDSLNDLEMIQECALGIAMGNADERLKPYADYVTDDIDKDGIYKAFVKYKLI